VGAPPGHPQRGHVTRRGRLTRGMTSLGPAVEEIADLARRHRLKGRCRRVLTCGAIASALGSGDDASPRSSPTARRSSLRARGRRWHVVTARLRGADGAGASAGCSARTRPFAVSGVGGPGAEEGRAAGTVVVATCLRGRTTVRELHPGRRPVDGPRKADRGCGPSAHPGADVARGRELHRERPAVAGTRVERPGSGGLRP